MAMLKRGYSRLGFSLVEMLIVLTLLAVVLSGIYVFFDYSQKVFYKTEAQSIAQDDLNNAMLKIAGDIRAASKPNKSTRAIIVYKNNTAGLSGDRIDIFSRKDGKFSKASYKYENNTLMFGSVERDTVEDVKSASIAYTVILEGVQYPMGNEMFQDVSADPSEGENDKRTIRINIIMEDKTDRMLRPYEITAEYTSRTKGIP